MSAGHVRQWGWVGGTTGALTGIGCALTAVYLDGASWSILLTRVVALTRG